MQGVKLKEIGAKAAGKEKPRFGARRRRPFGRADEGGD
jgi:hypothetical protein